MSLDSWTVSDIKSAMWQIVTTLEGHSKSIQLINDMAENANMHMINFLGVVTIGLVGGVLIFLNVKGDLLSDVFCYIGPAYCCILGADKSDAIFHKKWHVYWVVLGFLHLIEYGSGLVLKALPLYYFFKTLLLLYIAMTPEGAAGVYEWLLKPIAPAIEGALGIGQVVPPIAPAAEKSDGTEAPPVSAPSPAAKAAEGDSKSIKGAFKKWISQ
ncbi:TB2/DP1, HVA22 family-domain-containing protein [Polychytrium aggregatum]|uniref:TB2/DP1, HVA22 family-domain-containing protein n=1 Tax=Polychytrium aggregatum TaxID=110093 RepID=UPI0022FE0DE8|nr:TB2/DP1, HVA22 family-domain-containing protein [Polychytrium aggregatum]KAI9204876.1 TB2/DP1, HVA22 family-domain-containing protein [Polychytrium aggregatum]